MVHVLSGRWPFPGEAVRVNPQNPNDPNDVLGVSEFNRREDYINDIGKEHPLMTLIQHCLSNSPSHRSTSSEVHQQVSAVAADHPPSFSNRMEMLERIKALREEKENVRMQVGAQPLQSVESHEVRSQTSDLQAEIEELRVALASKDALLSSESNKIQCSNEQRAPSPSLPKARLTFNSLSRMPFELDGASLALIKGSVYVHSKYQDHGTILQYNTGRSEWNTLPRPPTAYSSICSLFGKPLLVGGKLHNVVTADIHEFDEASQQWVRSTSIPPMPTARSSAAAVSWTSPPALIVCGGKDQNDRTTTVVEVYHSRIFQWHAASPLLFPRSHMTYTVVHNSLFIMGGLDSSLHSTKSVIFTSIPDLLDRCLEPSEEDSTEQWQSLPDTPNYCSGAASIGGCLLAVGGQSQPDAGNTYTTVHVYCPSTSSSPWLHVGDLPQSHTNCSAVTLPTGELVVIGGVDATFNACTAVYKGSIRFE